VGKFDRALRAGNVSSAVGPIKSSTVPTGKTFEGGDGYARDAKGQLFLLAVTNFVGESTFYETSQSRDSRYASLIREVTKSDPLWVFNLLKWLRSAANMRSACVVGAVQAARVMSEHHTGYSMECTPRKIIDAVCLRADEPGEILAYWWANFGRKLPKWLKRGLGDAALRLYTPYTFLKYDSRRNTVRFADVIEVSHIRRSRGDESGLFKHILDAREGASRKLVIASGEGVPMLEARARVLAVPQEQRREALVGSIGFGNRLRDAGMTWEAISGWIQGRMDAAVWQRLVQMNLLPYGALLRNLANLERAQVDADTRALVIKRITNPELVLRSRLLPMAFLNAYLNVPGDAFKAAIDEAATLALSNVPRLAGRTLILVDTSGSMAEAFTQGPKRNVREESEPVSRWNVAALFGLALARSAENATVVSFAATTVWQPGTKLFTLRSGENLLAGVARFRDTHFIGGGTQTAAAVRQWYANHDRVICLTDEQVSCDGFGVFSTVPADIPVFTFNLSGYQMGHDALGPNRYVVAGLSDAGFSMISALEAPGSGWWPWEK
jgi:hypothetical protein